MPTFGWGRKVYFKDDKTNNILKGKMFEPRIINNELYIFIIQPVFAKSKSDMKLIIKFANALKTMSKTQKQELAKRLDNTV